MFTLQIYTRHLNKIKRIKKFFIFKESINEYYIWLVATYILIVIFGIIWWSITKEYIFMLSCFFFPLVYECYLILYYNWKLNDYSILGDIEVFNKKIEAYKKLKVEQKE